MAARPKSGITADTDVNLDFLTKEEKEALLSKKMDIIRQRNKALTERHKLIEADKKKAEEAGQAVKPTVDSQTLPAEGAPKSRGRGRGQPHQKDINKLGKERPKSSGDPRDSSQYEPIVDTADLLNFRNKGRGGPFDRDTLNNTPKNKRKPQVKEEATAYPSNFEYEPIIDMKDLDSRFGPLMNTTDVWSQSHNDHGNHSGHRHSNKRHDEGPPPDPSFNPLADRRRSDKKEDSLDHRRHPRNYGGTSDLSRVKQNMKNMREKEKDRPQGNKPLDIAMTGKERKNHEEWKAERDKYDKERIQRQMSDGGNWKRAWDADKIYHDNEEPSGSYTSRMEPAKRPAGRIGSGRFDRGERDDRPRSAVIGKGSLPHTDYPQQQQRPNHHDLQQLQLQSHHSMTGETKTPRGRGRGRGRGRSRGGGPGETFPRPRTWSGGDDRFVECQKELLLVKFDNTAGDNSVEVEYDDDEFLASSPPTPKLPQPGTTPGRGPTGRTPNQVSKQQSRGSKQQQKTKTPQHKESPQGSMQPATESKWDSSVSNITFDQTAANCGTNGIRARTHSHSHSYGDSEDWEDCNTESSGMHEEDDFNVAGSELSDTTCAHDMYLECRLNPDAPEFLPSTPEVIKAPPGHVLIQGGGANSSLSQCSMTSPQPLSQGLSTSPRSRPSSLSLVSSPGSPVKAPQWREEADVIQKDDMLPTPHAQSAFQNTQQQDRKANQDIGDGGTCPVAADSPQDDGDKEYIKPRKSTESSRSNTSMDSTEFKDIKKSCSTTSEGGMKRTTTTPSVIVDSLHTASDISKRLEEDPAKKIKVILPQEDKTSGHSPVGLASKLEQASSSEFKNISIESGRGLAAHESKGTSDLMKEMLKSNDPAESLKVHNDMVSNGDKYDNHNVIENSATEACSSTVIELCGTEVATEGPKGYKNNEEHVVHAERNGSSVHSDGCLMPGSSQSSPIEHESATPTADISASS